MFSIYSLYEVFIMAGNIQNLSLAQLKNNYETYRSKVTNIRDNLYDIYMGILTLTTNWTGRRMNAIIEKYNTELVPKVIPVYDFFADTVSNILQEICEQYESMENSGTAQDVSHKGLNYPAIHKETLDLTTIETVKFEQEAVLSKVDTIISNLDNLEANVTNIVTILDELSSASDSLNKLVTNYHSQSDSLVSTVKEVQETLKTEVNNAVKVVQTTESYNDSDASRVQTGEASE